jgi:hypothetical protein
VIVDVGGECAERVGGGHDSTQSTSQCREALPFSVWSPVKCGRRHRRRVGSDRVSSDLPAGGGARRSKMTMVEDATSHALLASRQVGTGLGQVARLFPSLLWHRTGSNATIEMHNLVGCSHSKEVAIASTSSASTSYLLQRQAADCRPTNPTCPPINYGQLLPTSQRTAFISSDRRTRHELMFPHLQGATVGFTGNTSNQR